MKLDRRLLQLAKSQRSLLALSVLMGLAAGVLIVIQARLLSRVVSLVFLRHQGIQEATPWLVWVLGLIFLRAVLVWGSEAAASELALRVKSSLRRRLFNHLQALGPAYLRGERSGELSGVLLQGVEALEAYFSQYLPQVALAALAPLTFLIFVFPLDWLSGVVMLLTAPLIPIFMILIGSLAQALTNRQWQSLSRMSAYFLDVLQGITTLKILGRSQAQISMIAEVSERFRLVTMSVLRVTFLSALVLELVSTVSTAVVAVQVGLRLLYGWLDFEQAFFVLLLAPEFYLPLRMLGARFHAGMAGLSAAVRIFEVLQTPLQTPSQAAAGQPGEAAVQGILPPRELSFNQVCLDYDGRQVLDEVSFTLARGEKLAVVGPSGAGKSSLAHLLLRFMQPTGGEIRLDGRPLNEHPVEGWRSQIAWVPQVPYLFHGTVLDNIRLGNSQAGLEQVMQAARLAHAHEFICEMPGGYDTLIGERGARLSGGQAQRIALARAFLRDAPVVILDEATANLDAVLEAQIQESIERLLVGKTALIIAHRLNTVRSADQILVLEQGSIVESGTHQLLLEQNGAYARLLKSQDSPTDQELVQVSAATVSPALSMDERNQFGHLAEFPRVSGRLGVLMRLSRFVFPFSGLAVLSIFSGFATVASSIGLMAASAYIISYAALGPSIAELQVAIVGVRFFGITRGLFRYLERYLSHQVTFRVLARLRTWFYQALEPLAPARLMRYRGGDLLARILGDVETLENFFVRVVAPPWVAGLVSLLAFAILSHFNPRLGWLFLGFVLLGGAGLPLLTYWLGRKPGGQIVRRRGVLSAAVVDGLQGMADLAAYNQLGREAQVISSSTQALAQVQRRFNLLAGMQTAVGGVLANLALLAVLALAIPLVQTGRLNGVYLAVVALTALTGFEAVNPLPLAAQYLGASLQAAHRLFSIVDTPAEVKEILEPLALPDQLSLEVKNLSFSYPAEESYGAAELDGLPAVEIRAGSALQRTVLDGVTFSLPQGKHLAIVGPSGAGKSTLVNLLLRFWEFHQGQILLEGEDLRDYSQQELRKKIAVVSQSTYLFSASLRDNLRLANIQASQEQIEQAAALAGLHDFIQGLPQGYDTWAGEHGLRLSGGERQRLAIARALLKEAPVLFLDEATANLDAITERQVLQTIAALMKGKTTLMVTHRLVGLEAMDEILVMDKGKIVERGTHSSLLSQEGLYRRMWKLQHQSLADLKEKG